MLTCSSCAPSLRTPTGLVSSKKILKRISFNGRQVNVSFKVSLLSLPLSLSRERSPSLARSLALSLSSCRCRAIARARSLTRWTRDVRTRTDTNQDSSTLELTRMRGVSGEDAGRGRRPHTLDANWCAGSHFPDIMSQMRLHPVSLPCSPARALAHERVQSDLARARRLARAAWAQAKASVWA